jgi:hypothetical protein
MVWGDSETSRLIQIATVREVLQEGSVFGEVINVSTDSAGVGCEWDVAETAEILNAEDREASGNRGVGNGLQER